MNPTHFIIEKQSPFDVPTTTSKLIEAATAKNWQNPFTHNLQQSLAKSGKNVMPVQVVEICKPEYSGNMLDKSDERIFSVIMPCRISVYEKADGHTYVALLDGSALAEGLPSKIADPMVEANNETLEIVNSVVS